MMIVATAPWTYWMALPILVATVASLLAFVFVYLKKVVEPGLLYQDELRALELAESRGRRAVGQGRGTDAGSASSRLTAA